MDELELERWRKRPMKVTSSTLCDDCNTMRPDPDVKKREYTTPSYMATQYAVSKMCCASCFEVAKRNAAAESQGLLAC